jgi:hypothetical protein
MPGICTPVPTHAVLRQRYLQPRILHSDSEQGRRADLRDDTVASVR